MTDPVSTTAAALLGAVVGSYLNVVVHRRPEREATKAKGTRSACPACGAPIPATLNIPIASWVWLRGRARCCGAPIPLRYPGIELLTALLFLALAMFPPLGRAPSLVEPDFAAIAAFGLGGFFVANLVANTFIDFDFRILPDRLTYPLMYVGVGGALLVPAMPGAVPGLEGLPQVTHGLIASLLGLATGLGLTWGVRQLGSWVFRQEAMGLGDVKLMAGIGAFLGFAGALITFFLGCVLGAVVGGIRALTVRDPRLAFGPYLAIGAVVTLFLRTELIVFLTETWPQWQRESDLAPLILLAVALLSFVALIALRRARRSS